MATSSTINETINDILHNTDNTLSDYDYDTAADADENHAFSDVEKSAAQPGTKKTKAAFPLQNFRLIIPRERTKAGIAYKIKQWKNEKGLSFIGK